MENLTFPWPTPEGERNSSRQRHEKLLEAFYGPLPQAVEEVRSVFGKFGLTQRQAACVTACALNQMASVDGDMPNIATVSLTSALNFR